MISNDISPIKFELILFIKSLIKNIANKGELGSPCLTPVAEASKKGDKEDLYLTHDLTQLYIALIALTKWLLIFSFNNFCHKYG